MWDKAAAKIDHTEKSAQLFLSGRWGKVGHDLDIFRDGATSVADS